MAGLRARLIHVPICTWPAASAARIGLLVITARRPRGCFLNVGITSAANRSSCSRMTRFGVPTTWPTLTCSSPG